MKHEGSNQMRQAPSKGAPSLHSSIRPRRKAETAAALLTELNPHAMRSPGSIPVRKSAKAPENGNHGRASGFGQPGLGVQDAISCLGCKAGFCRQVLNGERQEGSVTNVRVRMGSKGSWLYSQLCHHPRSGQVTCPPTFYIFRA